jgi:transposase-like protein
VLTENQSTVLEILRDRNGTFEPLIIPKYEKRVPLFNDQIISMHSFGMTARDIKAHLEKIYNVEVSLELISHVTEAVMEEVSDYKVRRVAKPAPGKILRYRVSGGRPAGQNPSGWQELHKERIRGLRGGFRG